MKYVTYIFQYGSYFPTIGFFIGMFWGFAKSSSSRGTGGMGLAMSIAIGGAVGVVVGVVARFFAHYVTHAQAHPGIY